MSNIDVIKIFISGNMLSMGYGFVEYMTAEGAMEALKTLQHHELDGHKLELKISHRETL
jgi:multiple RNA-binding domain-containing protein 1